MAEMRDDKNLAKKYRGEWKAYDGIWNCIRKILPDTVGYFNRKIQNRRFDFCLVMKDKGVVIIEVKGWNKTHIGKVGEDRVVLTNGEDNDWHNHALKQAKEYCNILKGKLKTHLKGKTVPIKAMVCYPFLTKEDCEECGLSKISRPKQTLFKEDIADPENFERKINDLYKNDPNMDQAAYGQIIRFLDELPNMKTDSDEQPDKNRTVEPYSRLSVFPEGMTSDDLDSIIDSYFKGTKQILFTGRRDDLDKIAERLSEKFSENHILVDPHGNLALKSDGGKQTLPTKGDKLGTVFNFEAFYTEKKVEKFQILNGELTEERKRLLSVIAEIFNYEQYCVEHADVARDLYVTAGAGTGKTFSMVSRVAFLCHPASKSGVNDPAEDLAMLTFTDDAADNMKSRLKQRFMNEFILTGDPKYLEKVASIEKMRVSTIHSFAREIIANTATLFGVGTEFNTKTGTYDKEKIFNRLLDEYLKKNGNLILSKLDIPYDAFRKNLFGFADTLYQKGCDVEALDMKAWGEPSAKSATLRDINLNDIIEKVVMETEKEYDKQLIEENAVAMSQYMIYFKKCVDSDEFDRNLYSFKYVFIDEFQDTDNAQIDAFLALQKKIKFKFFLVGDLRQSIYRFRGATISAFDRMGCGNKKKWLSFSLNINYRSDRRLLERFNKTFEPLLKFMNKKNKQTGETNRLRGIKENKIPKEDLVVRNEFTDKKDRYNKLFEMVLEEKKQIEKLAKKEALSEKERTIAILTRTNSQIKSILEEAKKLGICIETDTSNDLYELEPSKDLFRLTQALCNPYNPSYLYALLCSNNVNLNLDIRSLVGKEEKEKVAFFQNYLDKFYKQKMGKTWEELIDYIRKEPAPKVLREIYVATEPWRSSKAEQIGYQENYELIFENLFGRQGQEGLTLESINESLYINILVKKESGKEGVSAEARDAANDDGKRVRIICRTVHKSKGLEYGTVILPYTDKDMTGVSNFFEMTYTDNGEGHVEIGYAFPNPKPVEGTDAYYCNNFFDEDTEGEEAVEEEKRILYVAMTRAINKFIWLIGSTDDKNSNDTWGGYLKKMHEEEA